MDVQRRDFFRVTVTLPIKVWRMNATGMLWGEYEAETADLSGGGMSLRSPQPIGEGQPLRIELTCEQPELDLIADVRVLRAVKDDLTGEYVAACQFSGLSDDAQSRLVRFCFAEERMVMERRSAARVTAHVDVTGDSESTRYHGETVDLSADGALINAEVKPAVGESLRMQFGGDPKTQVQAEVIRVCDEGFAITYPDAPAHVQAAIIRVGLAAERRAAAAKRRK